MMCKRGDTSTSLIIICLSWLSNLHEGRVVANLILLLLIVLNNFPPPPSVKIFRDGGARNGTLLSSPLSNGTLFHCICSEIIITIIKSQGKKNPSLSPQ